MPGMGMGGMPDLSKMDPKQLEALKKQAEAAGLGKGMPGGLPGLGGGGGLPGLPGGMKLPGLGGPGGLPGLRQEEVRGRWMRLQPTIPNAPRPCWATCAPRSTASTRR